MLTAEMLSEVVENPVSEWGDDLLLDDDEDGEEIHEGNVGDENDPKTAMEGNISSRPTTTKSVGSTLRSEGKRPRIKAQRPALYSFGSVGVRRDPIVDSIIQNRKNSIVENPYTRLAQTTSLATRITPRMTNPFEMSVPPVEGEDEEEIKETIVTTQMERRVPVPVTSELEDAGWDDGLSGEHEREKTPVKDKSCAKLYEETCKRLNICPCSMIVRSLNTTEIHLRNYGLGPRGCAALAVGLVRNTTVTSLNLSQNNIGNHGMSHIYHVLMENTYIEDYDLSFNNLGTKGITKVANGISHSVQVKSLSVAGNELTANDIQILLVKLEDHSGLRTLNISHNQLEEEGGVIVAKWLGDNNNLLHLDMSWCSIRLTGAKAMAKAIGDNNRLLTLDLSHNSFTNETIDLITQSLSRNMMLCELNLRGNQFISRFDASVKENPTLLITGKENQLYKMIVAAATNQTLKIFRLGQNHIDARCLMTMLESLSKIDQISLEELDLTGLTITPHQISKVKSSFSNHSKFTCSVGPIRQTTEHFVNILLNLIDKSLHQNQVSLSEMFKPPDAVNTTGPLVTYEQFLDGLRRAKIPFPIALIHDIMKYIGRDNEEGWISLRSLILD